MRPANDCKVLSCEHTCLSMMKICTVVSRILEVILPK